MAEGGSVTNHPEPTAEAVATWLAEVLRTHGLEARTRLRPDGWRVYGGNSERDEDALFVSKDNVVALAVSVGRTKVLRKKTIRFSAFDALRERCADIAARFKEHKANCAAQEKAWNVADVLKKLGLPACAWMGRVEIKLDLSSEYAAEVGPKIAAVMSERKEGAT